MYRANWKHFVPIALAYFLVLSLITLVLGLAFGPVGALASAFVSLVGTFWLQGTLVEAVADVRDGRADLSIGETFSRARPHIWTLLGAGILAALGIVAGLVLLIIPGLVLLTWWSLIAPVIVLERVGVMESFGRSRGLVRGHGWSVFGVIVLTIVILLIVSLLITIALVWLPEGVHDYVSNVVTNTLLVPFVAVAWTLMYYRLSGRGREPQPAPDPALP